MSSSTTPLGISLRTCVERSRVALALAGAALLLSACGGGGGRSKSPPPPPQLQPGSLQFQAGNLAVDENTGTASVTITRTGGSDGAVSVSVASKDGSATAAQDYTSLSTTVNFAAGDAAAKTVTVPISDDAAAEADETFTLTLSAPSGGARLGANTAATLTIRDNDPPAAPALSVGSTLKQLTFNWASVPGATSYRLFQDPNGTSGFTQVGAEHAAAATSATLDVAVHRHDWVNARYRLEACNVRGCTSSNTANVVDAMLGAIGYFKASNTDQDDFFGTRVAVSADGNTLAVGATAEDSNARGVGGDQTNNDFSAAGAVYVFTRAGGQWSQQAYVKASNADAFDFFGSSLALSEDGNTLAVGAMGEDSNARGVNGDEANDDFINAGAVYVFTRAGGQWSQQAYVKASNAEARDGFGSALDLSDDGNTLAVGAPLEDSSATEVDGIESDNDTDTAGAVYVFTRAGGQWSRQAYVKPFNTGTGDKFGSSLAVSRDGNTLAVGAPGEDSNATGVGGLDNDSATEAGAVYVFRRDGVKWLPEAYVKAPDSQMFDQFGNALALSGDGNTLAVGAEGEDGGANDPTPGAGAVYVYSRGTLWTYQSTVKASNAESDDEFGSSLSLSADGSTLAVAAIGEDSGATGVGSDQNDNGSDDAGAVYVFTRSVGPLWPQQTYVKASNAALNDFFGNALALSGDGSTLAVGTESEDGNATGVGGNQDNNEAVSAGAVYMF